MAQQESAQIQQIFSLKRLAIPLVIGLGFSAFFIIKDFDIQSFKDIPWATSMIFWFVLAFLAVVLRQLGYMYRIWLLTDKQLGWKKSFQIISLWEYASALTPSIVGGTAAALFMLSREKINAGRTTAIVLLTAYLDELFFIVITPLVIAVIGFNNVFPNLGESGADFGFDDWVIVLFVIGYLILLAYTLFLAWGLFRNPKGLKNLLVRLFSIRWLKKWRDWASTTGDEVIVASEEFSKKRFGFWTKAFLSTVLAWVARYVVVNFIIIAFSATSVDLFDHLIIVARQLPLWIILLIPVTPGGAGLFETGFPWFFGDYFQEGTINFITLLIRVYSYYIYLLLGTIVLPIWLSRVMKKKKASSS